MSYKKPWYDYCKEGDKVESIVRKNAWSDSNLPFFKWLITTHPKIGECHEIERLMKLCSKPHATCKIYLKLKDFDYYRIATDFAPCGQSQQYTGHKIICAGGGGAGSILLDKSASPTHIIAPLPFLWRDREGRCLPLSFPLFSQLFGHISNVFPFIHSLSFLTANYGSRSLVTNHSSEGTQAHDEHAQALAKSAQGRKGVENV